MSEYLERLRKKRDCPDAKAKLEQQKIDKEQSDKEAMYADLFKDAGLVDEPLSHEESLSDADELWVDDDHDTSTPSGDMWEAIDEIELSHVDRRIVSLQAELDNNTEETVQLPLYERVWFKYGASSLGLLAACAEIYRAFKY